VLSPALAVCSLVPDQLILGILCKDLVRREPE
jgi:hypothetical protein